MGSLLCYCIETTGSDAYGPDLLRLDACDLNPTMRAVMAVGFSVRLATPPTSAGLICVQNIFIQRRATVLGLAFRV